MKNLKPLLFSFLSISFYTTFDLSNSFEKLFSKTSNNNKINENKKNKKFNDKNLEIKRMDSFKGVDSNLINQETDRVLNKIDNMSSKDIYYSKDHKHNSKDLLKEIFTKRSYNIANQNYLDFISSKSNYVSSTNNLKAGSGPQVFPTNYEGVYFPWWTFGSTCFWYMSSDTVNWIYNFTKKGDFDAVLNTAFIAYLVDTYAFWVLPGVGVILFLLTTYLMYFFSTFIMEVFNNKKLDKSQGIVLSLLLVAFNGCIVGVWSQSNHRSPVNSFTVDYRCCAPDYITVCVDEESLNVLMNIWNFNNDPTKVKDFIISYLKNNLTQLDHTGAFGGILPSDYETFYDGLLENDFDSNLSSYSESKIVKYLSDYNKTKKWKSVDIRIARNFSEWGYFVNT